MKELIQEFTSVNGRAPSTWTELGDFLLEGVMETYLKDNPNLAQVALHVRQQLTGYGIRF